MPAIVENLVQYDCTQEETEKLLELGLIVQSAEDLPDVYETTGLVWDDLRLDDDRCFILFDLILGRTPEEVRKGEEPA